MTGKPLDKPIDECGDDNDHRLDDHEVSKFHGLVGGAGNGPVEHPAAVGGLDLVRRQRSRGLKNVGRHRLNANRRDIDGLAPLNLMLLLNAIAEILRSWHIVFFAGGLWRGNCRTANA